jgi:hypothetical protein
MTGGLKAASWEGTGSSNPVSSSGESKLPLDDVCVYSRDLNLNGLAGSATTDSRPSMLTRADQEVSPGQAKIQIARAMVSGILFARRYG